MDHDGAVRNAGGVVDPDHSLDEAHRQTGQHHVLRRLPGARKSRGRTLDCSEGAEREADQGQRRGPLHRVDDGQEVVRFTDAVVNGFRQSRRRRGSSDGRLSQPEIADATCQHLRDLVQRAAAEQRLRVCDDGQAALAERNSANPRAVQFRPPAPPPFDERWR